MLYLVKLLRRNPNCGLNQASETQNTLRESLHVVFPMKKNFAAQHLAIADFIP